MMVKGKRRVTAFIIINILAIVIILYKYGHTMLFMSSEEHSNRIVLPEVQRGPILDRNGRILAIQNKMFSVTAWMPNVEDTMYTAKTLSEILDIDETKLINKLNTSSGFLYIKRKISYTANQKIQKLINDGNLPGISLEPDSGRNYPEKSLASHVIGYVGTDNIGLSGIEYSFNNELSPPSIKTKFKEIYGNQVFLTLDINIQHFIQDIAKRAHNKHNADSTMLLVMDAKTGEMLAYSSYPTFDPNTFQQSTREELYNYPVMYAYEPGSVFKAFTLASFLEMDGIRKNDTFVCNGYYENKLKNGNEIHINCLGVHGTVDAERILMYSCNAGAAYASDTITKNNFNSMLHKFGFGEKTGISLAGETNGILRSPEEWSARSKPTIAIGQEISVSAIQVITAATALTNNGMLLEPRIVKKIVDPSGEIVKKYGRKEVRRVISKDVADMVKKMLYSVTQEHGTAQKVNVEGLKIGAKTGTAQMIEEATGRYSDESHVASCLAFFPVEDPQLIVYNVIVDPKGEQYFGGQIAAPVVSESIDQLANYLHIPRAGDKVIYHSGDIPLKEIEPVSIGDTLPNLRGVPKRKLLPLLQIEGINVEITGEGWVVKQQPDAGTKIKKGMTIKLKLE